MGDSEDFDIFERVKGKIFKQRIALSSSEYIPDKIIGRDDEIQQIASLFAPVLDGDKPLNAFLYGKPGVGKTAVTKYVLVKLDQKIKELQANVRSVFINCSLISTTTGILKRMCKVIAPDVVLAPTGNMLSEYYYRLWDVLNTVGGITIVVLDEIDKLGDDRILYNLSRACGNMDITNGYISIFGISNDLMYKERLDARTLSSFGDNEIVFAPYDANELREILEDRARIGFHEGVVDYAVIPLCSALAAQEHGDARKALVLLENAGVVAVERGSDKITEKDVREAKSRLETDRVIETIKTLPRHQKLVVSAIFSNELTSIKTNAIYNHYKQLCAECELEPLSKSRISTFISELDMLGLITTRNVYRGRYGRVRLVSPHASKEKVLGILAESYIT
jgi:cell division control protein 6